MTDMTAPTPGQVGTPRTDAVVAPYIGMTDSDYDIWKEADQLLTHARTIERELLASQERVRELTETLRDKFAAKAMEGILATALEFKALQDVPHHKKALARAEMAYEHADAMLRARGAA